MLGERKQHFELIGYQFAATRRSWSSGLSHHSNPHFSFVLQRFCFSSGRKNNSDNCLVRKVDTLGLPYSTSLVSYSNASQLIETPKSFCTCVWYCSMVTGHSNPLSPACLRKFNHPPSQHHKTTPAWMLWINNRKLRTSILYFYSFKRGFTFSLLLFSFILRLTTTFSLWGNEEV